MTGSPTSPFRRGDVWYLSHGGPTSMYDTTGVPYAAWQKIGKMICEKPPKGVVVVCAHWESNTPGAIEVNVDLSNPLIYDFYGFPKHYYQEKFTSHGTEELRDAALGALITAGLKVEPTKRGVDHGVFVPFKVAFRDALDVPLIQVSLPSKEDPDEAVTLGRALASLRDEGYDVVGSGQIVHNLRDHFSLSPTPYSVPFLDAAEAAVHQSEPAESVLTLFRHRLYKSAHPTPEHLLPLAVSAGAVRTGDKVYDVLKHVDNTGMGWGIWRWSAPAAS